jgi:hypothetical protein
MDRAYTVLLCLLTESSLEPDDHGATGADGGDDLPPCRVFDAVHPQRLPDRFFDGEAPGEDELAVSRLGQFFLVEPAPLETVPVPG